MTQATTTTTTTVRLSLAQLSWGRASQVAPSQQVRSLSRALALALSLCQLARLARRTANGKRRRQRRRRRHTAEAAVSQCRRRAVSIDWTVARNTSNRCGEPGQAPTPPFVINSVARSDSAGKRQAYAENDGGREAIEQEQQQYRQNSWKIRQNLTTKSEPKRGAEQEGTVKREHKNKYLKFIPFFVHILRDFFSVFFIVLFLSAFHAKTCLVTEYFKSPKENRTRRTGNLPTSIRTKNCNNNNNKETNQK